MLILLSAFFLLTSILVAGQRPSFAGSRPIGYPDTPNRTTTTPDPLGNRFGEITTQRLPIEANGDRELVDRLSKLPLDKQPFWFINWQALEANRKNPQTYPQRPNSFVDPVATTTSRFSGDLNNRFSNTESPNSGFSNVNPISGFSNNVNSNTGFSNNFNSNPGFSNNLNPNPGFSNNLNPNPGFSNNVNSNPGFSNNPNPNTGFSNNINTNSGYPNTGILNTGYPNTVYTSSGFQSIKPVNTNTGYQNSQPLSINPNTGVPVIAPNVQTNVAFANGANFQKQSHVNTVTAPNGSFLTSFNNSYAHQAYNTYAWNETTTLSNFRPNTNTNNHQPNINTNVNNRPTTNTNQRLENRNGFEETTYPVVGQNIRNENRQPPYYYPQQDGNQRPYNQEYFRY